MDVFTSLLRSFGVGAKKAAANALDTWVPVFGNTGSFNTRAALEANREWVFIAIDKVARGVSGVRFKVMRYARNGDDREVFDGPLVDFLESPGEDITGKGFIYLSTAYKELTGNALWERVNKTKVRPLIPTNVSTIVDKGRITAFRYFEGGYTRTIPLKDVLHDRYMEPSSPHWGRGKLEKIARWVDTSTFATEFLNRFFAQGASFGGFIETEEESQERIKLIQMGLKNDHAGVHNAHKIGILPKGSKFSKVTANMSEIEMGETDDRTRDKILSAFGVPKTLVGLTTEVNRASAEAAEYVFAKYTVKPIVDDFIDFLNTRIAPLYDSTGQYYFAHDEFIPDDKEMRLKERETGVGKQPYLTINEVRATVGLPPVKGGDVVYGSPLLSPLGTPAAAPEPAPDEDEDEPKKAMPKRARAGIRLDRAVERLAVRVVEIAGSRQDTDEAAHKSFVSRVADHEKLVAGKVRDFNNRQEREVLQNLKQLTKAVKKGELFDMDGEVGLLVDFVTPMLKGLMLEQAIAEFEAQEFPGTFDSAQARIGTVVEIAARRLARSYNNTTANLLKSALNEGLTNGDDITQLAARVRQVYEFSDSVRALAVARTEAFFIANEGSREAYRQSGVVKTMRWYTAEDERVCEFCGPENGKTVGVNETFYPKGYELQGSDGGVLKLDYRAIDVPPLHTNCRCFIRPERIDIG